MRLHLRLASYELALNQQNAISVQGMVSITGIPYSTIYADMKRSDYFQLTHQGLIEQLKPLPSDLSLPKPQPNRLDLVPLTESEANSLPPEQLERIKLAADYVKANLKPDDFPVFTKLMLAYL